MSAVSLIFWVLALMLVALGVLLWTRSGRGDQRRDVMMRLRAAGGSDATLGIERVHQDPMQQNSVIRWANHWLMRIGYDDVDPARIRLALIAAAVLMPAALFLFGWFAGFSLIGFTLAVIYAVLSRKADQRRAQILTQLPDFLDAVTRILSAGNTLEEALGQAARESPDPIRPLFISIGRQVRLGASVEEVMREAAEVHRLRDLQVIALAASINRRYGGSLRTIFRSLIQAIRSRESAQRELRALTAETRFSAMVLGLIPVGLTLYILLQNPQYYADMWADASGRATLIFSVVLQVSGIFVIWRMMRSTEEADA